MNKEPKRVLLTNSFLQLFGPDVQSAVIEDLSFSVKMQ